MNVPKLRFNEFTDEWKNIKIKDIATIVSGGTPSTENQNYWNGEIQWFTPSEIGINKYISKSKRTITLEGLNNSSAKVLPKGTILLSSRATIGEASILENEGCTNQGFQSLVVNNKNYNEFIYYSKNIFKREMLSKAFGSTFLEISKFNLGEINIKIPNLNEQKKIANFLSLLDKKIELQTKKVEVLKLFKSSQIINYFNNLDEDEVELSKIGKFFSSSPLGKNLISKSGTPLILYGDLYTKYDEVVYSVNQFCIDKQTYKKSKKNDLIFPTSTTVDSLSLIAPSSVNEDGIVYGGDLIIFRLYDNNNLSDFISYEINYYKKRDFSRFAQGSTIIHIYPDNLLKRKIKLATPSEQKLIAKTFNLLNKKIELETIKLNKLMELKKGLMQNMFV